LRARTAAGCLLLIGGAFGLSSCATTEPAKQFRAFFVPPARPGLDAALPLVSEPPSLTVAWYAGEVPNSSSSLPAVSRPSDADFLMKRADDRFAAGKRLFQERRTEEARKEFDRVIDVLATAPENLMDRARLERHIEELVESIYRYDVDDSAAGQPDAEVSFEKSPLDDLLQMTFPIDPSLRNKVQEQIRATASQLPLEENDAVVSYINFFSSPRGKKILAYGLKRSGRYKPMIERVLREEGVPEELIFLAQAESGFSPRAMSRALCVGVWQFAAFRGKEYGLMQTPATDDRMDPERATQAAARHLHDLYNHFGDWNLAMAAYNCGPGCIDKAIQRTGYADFWTLRRLNVLPKETANYVPAILAMTIVGKNAKDYGLDDMDLDQPLEYDTIELASPTHLALVADAVDRPLAELREINPSLLRVVAPAGATLHVPKGTLDQLEAAFQAVPANRRDTWRLHRLQSDDTFATLGKRYTTTAELVSSANHDALPDTGGLVVIPIAYPGDRVPVRAAAPKARPGARAIIARTAVAKTTVSRTSAAKSTVTKSTAAKSTVAKKQAPGVASPVKGAKVSAPKGSVGRAG
jgi:membrane-bound lytic murein transglycosylase D